jgi:hypothetical protein
MAAVAYAPRDPAGSALYTVVREHVETFRVEAARPRRQGLPRFVDAEFGASCAAASVRVAAAAERAAHLVDCALPDVPCGMCDGGRAESSKRETKGRYR